PIGADATFIEAADPLDTPVEVPTLVAALERAHASNPQLLAARAQGRTAKIDVEVTDNGILPALDLSVIAGTIGAGNEASAAFDQLVKFKSYTVQASLAYHDTLGRRGVRGTALAARETYRKAQLTEADIRNQVDVAVVQIQAAATEAKRRLDV